MDVKSYVDMFVGISQKAQETELLASFDGLMNPIFEVLSLFGALTAALGFFLLLQATSEIDSQKRNLAISVMVLGVLLMGTRVVVASVISNRDRLTDAGTAAAFIGQNLREVIDLFALLLFIVSVIPFIIAFTQQDPASQLTASRCLILSGLTKFFGTVVTGLIYGLTRNKYDVGTSVVASVCSLLVGLALYTGLLLVAYSLFQFIIAIQQHDASGITRPVIAALVGIILITVPKPVFNHFVPGYQYKSVIADITSETNIKDTD